MCFFRERGHVYPHEAGRAANGPRFGKAPNPRNLRPRQRGEGEIERDRRLQRHTSALRPGQTWLWLIPR
eukprot:7217563-Alexandrium_andersonii.AAC.1